MSKMSGPIKVAIPTTYNRSKPHPENPVVSINEGNEEFGFISLRQEGVVLQPNGFLNETARQARFPGRVETLLKVAKMFNLKAGDVFSEKTGIDVKIIVLETTEPQFPSQDHKIYPDSSPFAGDDVTHQGSRVYRQTLAVPADDVRGDILLETDHRTQAGSTQAQAQMARPEFDKSEK